VRHPPFARGQCAACHEPHASDHAGLLKVSGGAACTACHRADAAFRERHGGYPVERASCETCHDPHASSRKGLMRANVHEPFAGGDCGTCHVAGTGSQPFALHKPERELCGDCHAEQVEASLAAPFPHVSAGGGACTDCHNPHAGEGAALLQRKGDDTCRTCHDPGGAASGQPGRYATHAGDVSCSSCHAPHGGEQPVLFGREQVAVCGDCHEHQHGITHPLGEATLDPRSGNPMNCGSCHGIHVAPYPKYMHASESRDLCVACHKDIGRRGP
jgi:predicted CXXCH cytochrome family protein